MRDGAGARVNDLLRRITGEADGRDPLERVARELRRRGSDLRGRGRRGRTRDTPDRDPYRDLRRSWR
jgi:hypothetical protein